MKPGNTFRNAIFISLALHTAIFAFPATNFHLLFPFRTSKLIEVSLGETSPLPSPAARIAERVKEETLPEEAEISKKRGQPPLPVPAGKATCEEKELAKKQTVLIPEPTDSHPERIVDFRGYPREAVRAIFVRYGLKYEKYISHPGPATTTNMVGTFTFEGKQLGNSREDSPVSFAGEPRPGSMSLVIPGKVYLDLLEAERKELRKRNLPLTIPLKKVVFGIGRDEQGRYVLAVRKLAVKEDVIPAPGNK